MTTSPYTKLLEDLDKVLATSSDVDSWNFFLNHGQFLREMALEKMPDEDRFNRARVKLRDTLSIMETDPVKVFTAKNKLEAAFNHYPDGGLVSTYQLGDGGAPGRLIAIWWQDDDCGSTFNELLWSIC